MILRHFIFFTLLFSTHFYELKSHELSICAIFRDDAEYLPEWIEFHLKQGVQHFYLYDNLSSDNPKKILNPYSRIVTLIDWPFESTGQDFFEIQCNAYLDCAKNNSSDKWIAFLDTDEFLFLTNKRNLRKFLRGFSEYGSVSAYWRMYGTSNITIPKAGKLTEYLTHRANDNFHAHKTMKTIAQPKYIINFNSPHAVISPLPNIQIEIDVLRINHYWSRDLWFFYNVKLPRREKWYHDNSLHIEWEKAMNEVYDPILSDSRT